MNLTIFMLDIHYFCSSQVKSIHEESIDHTCKYRPSFVTLLEIHFGSRSFFRQTTNFIF